MGGAWARCPITLARVYTAIAGVRRGMACAWTSQSKWRSTYSGSEANCVEVGSAAGLLKVRDTKDRQGPDLTVSADAWRRFTMGSRARDSVKGRKTGCPPAPTPSSSSTPWTRLPIPVSASSSPAGCCTQRSSSGGRDVSPRCLEQFARSRTAGQESCSTGRLGQLQCSSPRTASTPRRPRGWKVPQVLSQARPGTLLRNGQLARSVTGMLTAGVTGSQRRRRGEPDPCRCQPGGAVVPRRAGRRARRSRAGIVPGRSRRGACRRCGRRRRGRRHRCGSRRRSSSPPAHPAATNTPVSPKSRTTPRVSHSGRHHAPPALRHTISDYLR
jgi:hypothetical protein